MNLREQFEQQHGFPHWQDYTVYIEWLEDQMKQHAIEFAEWITSSGYGVSNEFGIWIHDMDFTGEQKMTTGQLYEQFKEQKP